MMTKTPVKSRMSFLGRARGLGSTRSGTMHFWHQRLTSIFLLFFTVWFLYALFFHLAHGYDACYQFFKSSVNATVMVLGIGVALYHAVLGLQMIIEDYVHCLSVKLACFVLVHGAALFLGIGTLISVFRIHTQPMSLQGVI